MKTDHEFEIRMSGLRSQIERHTHLLNTARYALKTRNDDPYKMWGTAPQCARWNARYALERLRDSKFDLKKQLRLASDAHGIDMGES